MGTNVAEKLSVSLLVEVASTLHIFEMSISACWITKLCHNPEAFATNYSFRISLSVPSVERYFKRRYERFEIYYLKCSLLFCKCFCSEGAFKVSCGFLVR